MIIYLIRHAQTVGGGENMFRGRLDAELSPTGEEQARACARYLNRAPLSAVFSGPLLRARQTAAAIANPHALDPEIVEGIDDIDVGDWEGLTIYEVARRWPRELAAWNASPHTFRFPNGESLHDVRSRCWTSLEVIADRLPSEATIALVTHRVVCKLLMLSALGAPTSSFWRVSQQPCAIGVLERRCKGDYVVHAINSATHLGPRDN